MHNALSGNTPLGARGPASVASTIRDQYGYVADLGELGSGCSATVEEEEEDLFTINRCGTSFVPFAFAINTRCEKLFLLLFQD